MHALELRKLALFASVAAAMLTACNSNDAISIEDALEEAQAHVDAGRQKGAIVVLSSLLSEHPEQTTARLMAARIFLSLGDGGAAEVNLRRISTGSETDEVTYLLLQALNAQAKFQDVIDQTNTAATPDLLSVRGEALIGAGRLDEARQLFDSLVAAYPTHARAWAGLARSHVDQMPETVVAHAERGYELAPEDLHVGLIYAGFLRLTGQSEQAVSVYRSLLKIANGNPFVLIGLATSEMDLRDISAAAQSIKQLTEFQSKHPVINLLRARHAWLREDYENSEFYVRNFAKSFPDDPDGLRLLGYLADKGQRWEQARDNLQKFLFIQSENTSARIVLVRALLKLQRTDDAMEVLEEGLQTDPNSIALLNAAGALLIDAGQSTRGLQYLERAVELEPSGTQAKLALASGRLSAGDFDGAADELRRLVNDEQSPLVARMLLVQALLQQGKLDAANIEVQRLLREHPKNVAGYRLDGLLRTRADDLEGAIKAYTSALEIAPGDDTALLALASLHTRMRQGRKAEALYKAALDRNPGNVRALVGLANVADLAGQPIIATSLLERAVTANPRDYAPRRLLTSKLLESRSYRQALASARILVSLNSRPASRILLGRAQLAVGDFDEAIETFSGLVKTYPAVANAHYFLGTALLAKGDRKAAIKSYIRTIERDPDHERALQDLVQAHVAEHDLAAARKTIDQYQSAHPNNTGSIETMNGMWHSARGEFGTAIARFEAAMEIAPSGNLLLRIVGALARSGDQSAATDLLRKWLSDHPTDIVVRNVLATTLLQQENFAAAAKEYEKIDETKKADSIVLNNLAYAYFKLGDDRAKSTALRAVDLGPNNPNALDTIGWIFSTQGDLGQAQRYLARAVRLAPENGSIRYHLAVTLSKLGDLVGARRELEIATQYEFSEKTHADQMLGELKNY